MRSFSVYASISETLKAVCDKYFTIFVLKLAIFELVVFRRYLMGANVFRRLETVNAYIENTPDIESFRVEAYKRLRKFIYDGSFSVYAKKDLLCKSAFWTEDKAAKLLGVSAVSVRRLRSKYTDACLSVIGSDAFDKVMTGSMRDVSILMQLCSTYSKTRATGRNDLFPQELISVIEKTVIDENAVYTLDTCKEEIALLHWLSVLKYGELVAAVDADKLNYLLKVLDGSEGKPNERVFLLSMLTCDSPDRHCKPEDRDSLAFPPKGYVPEDKMSQLTNLE